jgi:hypothetical protein
MLSEKILRKGEPEKKPKKKEIRKPKTAKTTTFLILAIFSPYKLSFLSLLVE